MSSGLRSATPLPGTSPLQPVVAVELSADRRAFATDPVTDDQAEQSRAVANGRRDEPSAIGRAWDSPGTEERLSTATAPARHQRENSSSSVARNETRAADAVLAGHGVGAQQIPLRYNRRAGVSAPSLDRAADDPGPPPSAAPSPKPGEEGSSRITSAESWTGAASDPGPARQASPSAPRGLSLTAGPDNLTTV